MGQRQRARELALKCLYAYESAGQDTDQIVASLLEQANLNPDSAGFAATLFKKVVANLAVLDETISHYSQNWEIRRLAMVDKNILRIGICELNCFPEIPAKVSINQAVELAKKYSTLESSRFVNGILDAIYKAGAKREA